ncbi:glycosyltransferase [Pantoea sp. S18]|uniref:glycosyltransferase family 2 protein n=1 Tax=Pantoea sp. S18 TaxID=3019892 RepID=UPI002B1FA53D|nr:glycosyltransferase [Pantoea sp. S18]MEA5104172.1 glycosyltransferase [Pantoea sp. S18]
MTSNKHALITFITVSSSGIEQLDKTINSLLAQSSDDWNQVILCAEVFFDQTQELLKNSYFEYLDKIKIISVDFNNGFASAINVGIRATESIYIQIMEADDVISEGFVSEIRDREFVDCDSIFYCNLLLRYETTVMKRPFELGKSEHPANNKLLNTIGFILEPSTFMMPFLFSRKLINKIGLLREEGSLFPMWDHIISMTQYGVFHKLDNVNYYITINKNRKNIRIPKIKAADLLNFKYQCLSKLQFNIDTDNNVSAIQTQCVMYMNSCRKYESYHSILKPKYNLIFISFFCKLAKLFALMNKRIFKLGAK